MTTAIAAISLSSPVFSSPRFFRTPLSESLTQQKAKSAAASDLKRKRPARLCIPVANMELELGDEMEKGIKEVEVVVEVEGDGYSVYSRKGKKGKCLEDRFSAIIDAEGSTKQDGAVAGVLGVFDGHGGVTAAEFAAKHMDANIMEEITTSGSDIQKAICDAYLKTDEEFMWNNNDNVSGGACCVSALIYKGSLIIPNAGDCRTVISQGGVAEDVTSDHRPSVNSEREGIEDDVSAFHRNQTAVTWSVDQTAMLNQNTYLRDNERKDQNPHPESTKQNQVPTKIPGLYSCITLLLT